MNAPNQPTPTPIPRSAQDAVEQTRVRFADRLTVLEGRVDDLESEVKQLKAQLNEARSVGSRDELADKILTFLKKYPGVKFNTGSIAANVGSTSMKLSDKLKNMVGKGLIKFEKEDKLSAQYWWEEDKNNE